MNTPIDPLRSFAASVCLTLGLARLAEILDPSALAAPAETAAGDATVACIACDAAAAPRPVLFCLPSSVPERAAPALSRPVLYCVPTGVPERAAMPCINCDIPQRAG